jgi:hypothetical protein
MPRPDGVLPCVLVFAGLLTACSSSSSPSGWTPPSLTPSPTVTSSPASPQFLVLSTDWQCDQPTTQSPYCAKWRAHGIFKNLGGPGQALVDFTLHAPDGQYAPVCTAVIPQTGSNGISEASCPTLATGYVTTGQLIAAVRYT